jgi:hypothetical protein
VNLRDIPDDGFTRKRSSEGPYYDVVGGYEISITFGVVMDFKLSYKGNIVGEITAEYED